MPQAYVSKLAKKHGISTATAEKHWSKAKAAAKREGKEDNYAYITSIFKNMMHESAYTPTLKDLTNGMTFKYFLVAEADAIEVEAKQHSPVYKFLADRFPQFVELPFKARKELEKEIDSEGLLDGYDSLSPEEQEGVESYLKDLVVDKMQAIHGTGSMVGDWKGEEDYQRREQYRRDLEAALDNEEGEKPAAAPEEKKQRRSSGPRHLAAMRQQHIPIDRAAQAPEGSDEIGGPKKSYYKPWSALSPEQRAGRSALAKKHGTIYRVKNSKWFRTASPEKQQAVINTLKAGGTVEDARKILAGE